MLIGDHGRQFNTWVAPPDPALPEGGKKPPPPDKVESPYRGLLAFREQDAPFFFGQAAAAKEILNLLRARAEAPALMVISGVSGAGKSSLLRAGVLPYLGEITPEDAPWPHLTLTPARSPLSELAACTARRTGKDAAALLQTLRSDPAGFALTALEAAGTPENGRSRGRLVLVVDQFEQVFTQCADENERRAFITALHAAATVGHGPRQVPAAMVVLIVRSDFVETRCADYDELVEAIQHSRYFLPSMTERQLRLAITEPARVAGTTVDDALVGKLVATIRETPSQGAAEGTVTGTGVLPHLSHALDQAWRHRAGDVLTLDDYERAGGIEGSIAASADHAYEDLPPAQQEAARQVFIRLTAATDSGTDTGDRASIEDLTQGKNPAEAADVQAVVEVFADQRLLTRTADSVELSHEALLTAWPLLRDTWLAKTRADRIVRTQLRTAAARWDDHDRNPSYLYRGTQLAALRDASARWSADPVRHPALAAAERDFLQASSRAARRAAVQRRIIAAALAILLAASLAATGIAVDAAGTARQQTAVAASRQLATQSEADDSTDPVTAALLAAASWRIDPSNPAARESLLDVYAQPDHATLNVPGGSVSGVAFSPDGRTLATVGSDGTVRLWDRTTRGQVGAPIAISSDKSVSGVAFSPDGRTLATADNDGTVRLWNVATRAQVGAPIAVPGSGLGVGGVAFSPDGRTLATAGSDETVRLWNVASRAPMGGPIAVPGGNGLALGGVAFSPSGRTLATATTPPGGGRGSVRLWDIATRAQVGAPIFVPGGVNGVGFSPDGRTLATGGGDGAVRLWHIATRAQVGAPITVPGSLGVSGVAFNPSGQTLATSDGDGTVRLWDMTMYNQVGAPIAAPSGSSPALGGVAFSPSGQTLAAAPYGGSGAVRLWNAATHTPMSGHIAVPGDSNIGAGGVAFSPDGRTLATGSGETVRLWNVATRAQVGAPIAVPDSSGLGIVGVAFSPDGRTLATGGGDGAVRLWHIATRAQVGAPITVPGSRLGIGGVAFSPDGRTLAAVGRDGAVRLWNVATRAQVGAPIAVPRGANGVGFSPDGRILATGGGDGAVRLWDIATRAQVGAPIAVPRGVNGVGFSPDGRSLATADNDGTVRLWNIAFPANLVNAACSIAGRSFTRREWKNYAPFEPFQQVCPAS